MNGEKSEGITPHHYWMILIGVFSISCSAIFIKFAEAPPIITAFYRMFFSVVILSPFILQGILHNRRSIGLTFKQIIISSIAGVFLALHFAFWITSLDYTSITSSTVLVTLQPLFVVFGEYFFYKESVGYRSLIGALLSICGGIILGYGDMTFGVNALIGDLYAFVGSIFVACYILIGRSVRKNLDLLPYTFIVYLSATIAFFLSNAFIIQQPMTGYPSSTWGWFVAMAVIPNLFGQSIFSWVLKYIKAAVVSVCILGEPVGASILAFIIWNQVPGLLQVMGGLLIITGLAIFILFSQQASKKLSLNDAK